MISQNIQFKAIYRLSDAFLCLLQVAGLLKDYNTSDYFIFNLK